MRWTLAPDAQIAERQATSFSLTNSSAHNRLAITMSTTARPSRRPTSGVRRNRWVYGRRIAPFEHFMQAVV